MAKHIYQPRISDIWKTIKPMIADEADFEEKHHAILDGAIARLEERDQQLEDAILGDLTVNDVSGTVGTVPPSKAKQIGWSGNFGFFSGNFVDSGRGDGSQDANIAYGNPFSADTTVLLITPILIVGMTSFGIFLRSSDKNGFVVTAFSGTPGAPAPPTPLALSYLAVGF